MNHHLSPRSGQPPLPHNHARYNVAGEVTGFKYGNGIYASLGFSPDRLQMTCLDYSTTNRSGNCTHDTTTKLGLTYSYGSAGSNNGQISNISDYVQSGRSITYTFDSLYRLTNAQTTGSTSYPAWGLAEQYDHYGNRTSQSISYGCVAPMTCPTNLESVSTSTNQITSSPIKYDLSGNMINDALNTLTYDAEGRAVTASGGLGSGTYTYDGNGLRVKKVAGSTTTVYLFSGSKVIAEYAGGAAPSSPTVEYVYAGAALLAKINSSGTYYYHQDSLSNRMVTNSTGGVVAEMGHFPFGEFWYNATNDKLYFTTYEYDAESGNHYAMARYHISRLGRLSSPDPLSGSIANPQSLNRYSYSINDPANITDPSGALPNPCPMAQNNPQDNKGQSSGDGPSDSSADDTDPPQQGGCNASLAQWLEEGSFSLNEGDLANEFDSIGVPIYSLTPTPIWGIKGYVPSGTSATGCTINGGAGLCKDSDLTPVYGVIGYSYDEEQIGITDLFGGISLLPPTPANGPNPKLPQTPTPPQTPQQKYQQCMSSFKNSTVGKASSFFSVLNFFSNVSEWVGFGSAKAVGVGTINAEASATVTDYSITAGTATTATTGLSTAVSVGSKALGVAGTVAVAAGTTLDASAREGCSAKNPNVFLELSTPILP